MIVREKKSENIFLPPQTNVARSRDNNHAKKMVIPTSSKHRIRNQVQKLTPCKIELACICMSIASKEIDKSKTKKWGN